MSRLNNIIVCIVGKSGCGKTTIANKLHISYNMSVLKSYTTRPKRKETDDDHIYIDEDTYFKLEDKVATTFFNNNYYCATAAQVDESDLYVVDMPGVRELKEKYHGSKKIVSIYLDVPMEECLFRMRNRGDDEDACWERLRHDEDAFRGAKDEVDCVVNATSSTCWMVLKSIIDSYDAGGKN